MKKTFVLTGLAVLALVLVFAIIAYVFIIPFSLFMSGPPETKSNGILHYITAVNSSEPLRTMQQAENGSFSFVTNIEPTDDCLMVVLVDYRAVPFRFNGTCTQAHLFGTGSGDAGRYSGIVQVPNISAGSHDLMLVYFVPPANFSYTRWGPANNMLAFASRYNVVSGNATRPEPDFNDNSSDSGLAYSEDYPFPNGVPNLVKKPFDSRWWSRENVKAGDVIDYYVTITHPTINDRSQYNATFALVQLLDYGQVPVRYSESEYVYYGEVGENETASVHLSLRAPETPGPHRLAVIVATNPYEDVETAPDVLNRDTPAMTWVEYVDLFVS